MTNEFSERLSIALDAWEEQARDAGQDLRDALALERHLERTAFVRALLAFVPETDATRGCVTHHACPCHIRLAEIGRRVEESE